MLLQLILTLLALLVGRGNIAALAGQENTAAQPDYRLRLLTTVVPGVGALLLVLLGLLFGLLLLWFPASSAWAAQVQ